MVGANRHQTRCSWDRAGGVFIVRRMAAARIVPLLGEIVKLPLIHADHNVKRSTYFVCRLQTWCSIRGALQALRSVWFFEHILW